MDLLTLLVATILIPIALLAAVWTVFLVASLVYVITR